MNVSKITIGRLYNLGNFEHIRYELTVEIHPSESATQAITAIEKILSALSPKTSTHSRDELRREAFRIEELGAALKGTPDEDEFRRKYGHFAGSPAQYVERCVQSHLANMAERTAWETRSAKARQLLDDLGGAAIWKDAKLDWETEEF